MFVLLDLALTRIGARKRSFVADGFGPVLAGVMFLLCALVLQGPSPAAVLTALSFALPTLAGWVAGRRWSAVWWEKSWIDVGLLAFTGVTCFSLIVIAITAGSVSEFHRASVLPWGASNYVAGVLVVCAFLLWARRPAMRVAGSLGVFAAAISILTLSRGAFLALGAGLLVLFWNSGRTPLSRLSLRALSAAVLVVGAVGMEGITAQRSVGGYDPSSNITARFDLYDLAWHEFLSSPVIGTGWLGLREPALEMMGDPLSFAHNVILSFLQIGGVLGLIWLVIMGKSVILCWTAAPVLRPALAATLAISMTDPFFESAVAAFVSWLLIGAGCAMSTGAHEQLSIKQSHAGHSEEDGALKGAKAIRPRREGQRHSRQPSHASLSVRGRRRSAAPRGSRAVKRSAL
ncbi:O-antigen ligase family protein [Dermacoccus abyssi]|uniref:O-antigen ligase family protein n=1 Tax=Dermacoccus abyssi TaxID=322596 RepID=UPI002AD47B18|nr:O-antigen ligase family protein [Dermacoccus abyssi]